MESRPVTAGARVDQDMVVETGLEPGKTVSRKASCASPPAARVEFDGRGRRGGGGRKRGGKKGGGEGAIRSGQLRDAPSRRQRGSAASRATDDGETAE